MRGSIAVFSCVFCVALLPACSSREVRIEDAQSEAAVGADASTDGREAPVEDATVLDSVAIDAPMPDAQMADVVGRDVSEASTAIDAAADAPLDTTPDAEPPAPALSFSVAPGEAALIVPTSTLRPVTFVVSLLNPEARGSEDLEFRAVDPPPGLRAYVGGVPIETNALDLPLSETEARLELRATAEAPLGRTTMTFEALARSRVVGRFDLRINAQPGAGLLDAAWGTRGVITYMPPSDRNVIPLGVVERGDGGALVALNSVSVARSESYVLGLSAAGAQSMGAGWSSGLRSIVWTAMAGSPSNTRLTALLAGERAGRHVAFGHGVLSSTRTQAAYARLDDEAAVVGDVAFVAAPMAINTRLAVAARWEGDGGLRGYFAVVSNTSSVASPAFLVRLLPDATLDSSFGTGGFVTIPLSAFPSETRDLTPRAIAVSDRTDRVLVAFDVRRSEGSAVRAGGLLLAFGTNGAVQAGFNEAYTAVSGPNAPLMRLEASSAGVSRGVFVGPDLFESRLEYESIVWVPSSGSFYAVGTLTSAGQSRAAIFRVGGAATSTGLDTEYNRRPDGLGVRVFDCASGSSPSTYPRAAVARLRGDGFVVGGGCVRVSSTPLAMTAFLAGFSASGERVTSAALAGETSTTFALPLTSTDTSTFEALSLTRDGKLLGVATSRGAGSSSTPAQIVVTRMHLDNPEVRR